MASQPEEELKKPRGPTTSYMATFSICRVYFVKHCHEQHKGQSCSFTDLTKECSEKWKALPKEERKVFEYLGAEDIKRYNLEKRKYVAEGGTGYRSRRVRNHKCSDPTAPVKPLTGFAWFSRDEGTKLKGDSTIRGARGLLGRTLARMWAEADAATRQKYNALGERDRARFAKEMEANKNQSFKKTTEALRTDEN